MSRKVNEAGVNLVKRFEGLVIKAYLCPAGIPTIGYGHTRTVSRADVGRRLIDLAEADGLLREDLAEAERAVERSVTVPLTDNQFAALVSFTFNLGAGSLQKSTLLAELNAGRYGRAAKEFLRWNKAGGRILAGLTARRTAEARMFVTPPEVA